MRVGEPTLKIFAGMPALSIFAWSFFRQGLSAVLADRECTGSIGCPWDLQPIDSHCRHTLQEEHGAKLTAAHLALDCPFGVLDADLGQSIP